MAKSTFDTELERALRLMEWEKKPVNESLSNVEFYKMGADDKVYGIVKEGTKYYIKATTPGKEKISESYDYLGGFNERGKHAYSDYNTATKHLEMELMALNEAYGKHLPSSTVDTTKSQKLFEGLTESARQEIDRINQIFENSCHIGMCNTGDPESKGKASAENTTKNNEPFSEKAKAELDKDPKFNGTVKGATEGTEVKGVEKDLESDKMKTANSGSEKDYTAAHDDLDGEGVADKKPAGGKVVKVNEELGGEDEIPVEEPVEEPSLDAPVAPEAPADDISVSDFEDEPSQPEGEAPVVDDATVGDDLVGIDDSEESLDDLLREFDAEYGSAMNDDDIEDVSEETVITGPNKVLDGPHGSDSADAKWERVGENADANAEPKEGGEESLQGPHGSLKPQTCDKVDEAFNVLVKEIYKNLQEAANKKIDEETTKLDAWGKHPKYQQAPFKTPANKEVLAGTAEKDWNDDSAKGEEAYGKKIGDGAPFNEKVLDLLTDTVMAKLAPSLKKK